MRVIHADVADGALEQQDVVGREDRGERLDRLARAVAGEHPALLGAERITHPEPDHEPVELTLGQDVGPLELVRVLGRQHDERRVERIGLPFDRDLAVAHRLEQGALGPGRGPVDLVGQDDVGEDRPLLEDELAARRVVDARAEDVRGEQVGGELDAPERAVDAGGQGPGQQRLADSGNVLDQDVPFGQQAPPPPA